MRKDDAMELCRKIKAQEPLMSTVVITNRETGKCHVSMVDPKTGKDRTFTSYAGFLAARNLLVPKGKQ